MLASLPLGYLILLCVVLPSLVSAGIVALVRRVKPIEILSANNDLAAITYPAVGLIYGVFLAFAIIIVWQRFSDAERTTYDEVTSLGALWRDANVFPADYRQVVHERLRAYVSAIETQEWPRMARGGADTATDQAFENLWKAYYDLEPRSEPEKAFYNSSVGELNAAGRYRRARLLYSGSEMPGLLWAFLLFGAGVTVVCSYFLGTRNVWMHALMSVAITALVGFSLVLIISLSKPFSGDISISHQGYSDLLKSFSQ